MGNCIEICEEIDLVPADILELVVGELLNGRRKVKPSLRELQKLCGAAMQIQEKLELGLRNN